jgi:chorismate synthase
MLRYFTSGESHGEALVAFLSGLPAGLAVNQQFVDRELWRRQQGRVADCDPAREQGLEELAGSVAGGGG